MSETSAKPLLSTEVFTSRIELRLDVNWEAVKKIGWDLGSAQKIHDFLRTKKGHFRSQIFFAFY